MEKLSREKIQEKVTKYFNDNAYLYIPNDEYLFHEEINHIINIGTSIICTRDDIGFPGGSFVTAMVNNDLLGAFTKADSTNRKCIYFYLKMMQNIQ